MKVLVSSSTAEGCQHTIEWIMKSNKNVSATIPVKAADGSYVASVHINSEKEIECGS